MLTVSGNTDLAADHKIHEVHFGFCSQTVEYKIACLSTEALDESRKIDSR